MKVYAGNLFWGKPLFVYKNPALMIIVEEGEEAVQIPLILIPIIAITTFLMIWGYSVM